MTGPDHVPIVIGRCGFLRYDSDDGFNEPFLVIKCGLEEVERHFTLLSRCYSNNGLDGGGGCCCYCGS